MSLSIKLQVRQSQSLVMTPQLLQSIRLLQFGHQELQAYIEREAEKNPLIALAGRAPAGPVPAPERTLTVDIRNGGRADERAERATDFGAPFGGGGGLASGRGAGSLRTDGPGEIASLAAARPSLVAHVEAEIADALPLAEDRRIAAALLVDLDEAGYLRVDVEAAGLSLGVAPARIAAILSALRRSVEPAGLLAGDLAECLALQLARRDRLDPVMASVLARLDLLAKRDFAALRRLTGEDEAGLIEILAEIRRLDPKPGSAFCVPSRETVRPDVFVWPAREGGWRVELNAATLPRILVDGDYARTVSAGCRASAEREFLGECQASANWLVRSLDQRAKTILKVASEIVRRQDGFLTDGISGLKPMTLAQVAEAVGLHESTVSRVTANKFIGTPRGTFELKYFFTVAIASSTGGEAHSAEGVKGRVRRLVAAEGVDSVLSDEDIVARLKAEGVELARRTVAKYREALGIASSVQRRRELNARRMAC